MNFEQRCDIPVAPEKLWRFLMDVPEMATCVPGVENVTADGTDTYRGILKVKLGPIGLTLNGTMTIQERDEANYRATGRAEGNDRRIGGGTRVNATMSLIEKAPNLTEMVVQAEVRFLGKLGEFGEPLIRKQADATVAAFARNVAARFEAPKTEAQEIAAPPSEMSPAVGPERSIPRPAPPARNVSPWIGAGIGLIVAIVLIALLPIPLWSSGRSKATAAAILAVVGAIIARLIFQPVPERNA
jgi:carbon monoxide dehydrogenase subunit G